MLDDKFLYFTIGFGLIMLAIQFFDSMHKRKLLKKQEEEEAHKNFIEELEKQLALEDEETEELFQEREELFEEIEPEETNNSESLYKEDEETEVVMEEQTISLEKSFSVGDTFIDTESDLVIMIVDVTEGLIKYVSLEASTNESTEDTVPYILFVSRIRGWQYIGRFENAN